MTPETKFKKEIKSYLDGLGIFNRPYSPGRYGTSGFPDRVCCINGIMLAIEAKSPTGRPNELQKKNIELINAANGIAVVLYPAGFETFKKLVEGVMACTSHIPELNALKAALSNTGCDTLMKDKPLKRTRRTTLSL